MNAPDTPFNIRDFFETLSPTLQLPMEFHFGSMGYNNLKTDQTINDVLWLNDNITSKVPFRKAPGYIRFYSIMFSLSRYNKEGMNSDSSYAYNQNVFPLYPVLEEVYEKLRSEKQIRSLSSQADELPFLAQYSSYRDGIQVKLEIELNPNHTLCF